MIDGTSGAIPQRERGRHSHAKVMRDAEIDDEFQMRHSFEWNLGRIVSFEYSINKLSKTPKDTGYVWAIGH